jgi:toxin ParE1/3/4
MGTSDAVDAAVRRLRSFPESGRAGRVAGTRELVVSGTPFIVIYRVKPSAVVIIRVLHAARRWP